MIRVSKKWPVQLAIALLSVAVGIVARWVVFLAIGTRLPYLTFFPAVITAALLGGWRAGATATILSSLAAALWMDPLGEFGSKTPADVVGIVLFVLICVYTVAIAEWMLQAREGERGARMEQLRLEERLRRFVEDISDGFLAIDPEWHIVYVNHTAAALVHRGKDDLVGRIVWEAFPQLVGSAFDAAYRKAVAEHAPVHVRAFYPPLGRWFFVGVHPSAQGLSVFFRDVTETVNAERGAREADERFRAAVDAGQIGTWDWDIVSNRVTWSERIYKLHGLKEGEFAGTVEAFENLIHADDRARVRSAIEGAMREHTPYEIEFRAPRPDGEIRWLQTHGRVLYDEQGTPLRLVGATVDVTERRLAEEEKTRLLANERSAREEAEHAGRMKDEFLATLSHELRTPLNAILGWSQLLRQDRSDTEGLEQGLEAIERNARAQTQLIEDLLDMSRIISGKLGLDIRTVDLRFVIESAVQTVTPAAQARQIRLEVDIDPKAGSVSGDPGRLQQVAWNLLSNAIKFTPRGGKVRVQLSRVNSHIELSVSDTGQGISADFLPYVFDRFRQADSSTTRRHGGLGLGLSIVKNLVELHGGTIAVTSPGVGAGTTFTVTLPVTCVPRTEAKPESVPRDSDVASIARNPEPPAPSLQGIKVLAVDDEPDARRLIERMLERCHAKVRTVASAEEGLTALATFAPDVVMCDIGMPDVDGYEFVARLRTLPPEQGGRIPAIALTAFARAEDRTRALLAGYAAHISKPAESAELATIIASVAGRIGAVAPK